MTFDELRAYILFRKKRFILIVLSVIFSLFVINYFYKEEPKEILRPVRTLTLQQSLASSEYTYNGIARSESAAKLSFNISGTVKKVHVKLGQKIKKGDIIAELDATYFELKHNEVSASLKRVLSQFERAKSQYERIQQLYVNRNSSLSNLESARTDFESSKAQYSAMKNRLAQVKLELTYTKLRAPIDGSISDISIRKSENITTATPISTISSIQNIEVPVSIPANLIADIKTNQECVVYFEAMPSEYFQAVVTEISQTSKRHTTTFPIIVHLISPSKKIRPGMVATVSFSFGKQMQSGEYILPINVLQEDKEGRYVYIALEHEDKDIGVIHRTRVVTGELKPEGILVTHGLEDGMDVITAGMSRLHENQRIKYTKQK